MLVQMVMPLLPFTRLFIIHIKDKKPRSFCLISGLFMMAQCANLRALRFFFLPLL